MDKTQERACCNSQHCGYDFCIKCSSTFHGSTSCQSVISDDIGPESHMLNKVKTKASVSKISGKQNKRRLRRL